MERAIGFYRDALGFAVQMHPAPAFRMLARGELRLLLGAPGGRGGGGQALADGSRPEPGGWNRIRFEVDDPRHRDRAPPRDQVLVEDPSGNLVELFQPKPGS